MGNLRGLLYPCSVDFDRLVMLALARLAVKVTRSGGSNAYVETAFGRVYRISSQAILWYAGVSFSDAAVANAFVELWTGLPVFTVQ